MATAQVRSAIVTGLAQNTGAVVLEGLARDAAFAGLVARSCHDWLGKRLEPPGLDPAAAAVWLYERAPFCLLAHDTAADPRFVYANLKAQRCFEYDWDEITGLPSRLSAGPEDRAEWQRFVDAVEHAGFATGYRGLRAAKSGRRFWIEDVTMWRLIDDAGMPRGHAALYDRWTDA